jgi:hypothetical protein
MPTDLATELEEELLEAETTAGLGDFILAREQIETQLRRNFRADDEPGYLDRRKRLRLAFRSVPKRFARRLLAILQEDTSHPLTKLFRYKLHPATQDEMISILKKKLGARTGAPEFEWPETRMTESDERRARDLARHLQTTPVGRWLAKRGGRISVDIQIKKESPLRCWAVRKFGPGSPILQDFQRQHIRNIGTQILSTLAGELRGKRVSRLDIALSFEGHLDKQTDPAPSDLRELDADHSRAWVVKEELMNDLWPRISKMLHVGATFSVPLEITGAGSTRPATPSRPDLNRRVVICAKWKITGTEEVS